MGEFKPLPAWADVLNSAGIAALQQTMMLFGGTHTPAERGLMSQLAENLMVAATMLRDLSQGPAGGHGSGPVNR